MRKVIFSGLMLSTAVLTSSSLLAMDFDGDEGDKRPQPFVFRANTTPGTQDGPTTCGVTKYDQHPHFQAAIAEPNAWTDSNHPGYQMLALYDWRHPGYMRALEERQQQYNVPTPVPFPVSNKLETQFDSLLHLMYMRWADTLESWTNPNYPGYAITAQTHKGHPLNIINNLKVRKNNRESIPYDPDNLEFIQAIHSPQLWVGVESVKAWTDSGSPMYKMLARLLEDHPGRQANQ